MQEGKCFKIATLWCSILVTYDKDVSIVSLAVVKMLPHKAGFALTGRIDRSIEVTSLVQAGHLWMCIVCLQL